MSQGTTARGWRYLPEVVLAGLVGADLWISSSVAGDLPWPWALVAPCAALPISAVAVLSVGPRRLADLAMAFAIAAAVTAAIPLFMFFPLSVLFMEASPVSLGAAIGIVFGHAAERVISRKLVPGTRVRMSVAGGAAGAAVAALLLCLSMWSPERHPTAAPLGDLLFVFTYATMPPVAVASVSVIAFLSHRAERGRRTT